MAEPSTCELIVCNLGGRVGVLVPKKRGSGFLKMPLGHRESPLSQLARDYHADFVGLDGALEIFGPGHSRLDQREADSVIETVVPAIAKLLCISWRVVQKRDFWELHPTANSHSPR